jgi:hypothetical protein
MNASPIGGEIAHDLVLGEAIPAELENGKYHIRGDTMKKIFQYCVLLGFVVVGSACGNRMPTAPAMPGVPSAPAALSDQQLEAEEAAASTLFWNLDYPKGISYMWAPATFTRERVIKCQGTASLGIRPSFYGPTETHFTLPPLTRRQAKLWNAGTTLTLRLYVPDTLPFRYIFFQFKDHTSHWNWGQQYPIMPSAGAWSTIAIESRSIAGYVGGKVETGYQLEVGFKLAYVDGNPPAVPQEKYYVDNIRLQ